MELCELKMLPEADDWPEDIDTRIANLDFAGGDSLLFDSFDPSVSTDSLDSEQLHEQIQEQCRPRGDDYQVTFDSGLWPGGQLTTWGRIRPQTTPDERTASAPAPRSLVTAFVDGHRSETQTATVATATRFVDVNDNEIVQDRWRAKTAPVKPPRRTFADLNKQMAPELQFLALPHKMPSLCESSTMSLSDVLLRVQREGLPPLTSDLDLPMPSLLQDDSPDSGLGCSGPSHIEDWASLSILLPKHVADACSFFKNNSQLLSGPSSENQNCIERSRRSEPCLTCFRVRRRLHPPSWAHSTSSRHVLCDCSSKLDERRELMPRQPRPPRPSLRSRELSVVGMPIYNAKRLLVEAIVEAVAAIARGDAATTLVAAMRAIVEDGLREGISAWQMICTVTAPGPATKDVYSIVKRLDSDEKSENSRTDLFFEELYRENSLDCWLCYAVLKENVLSKLYMDGAFLLRAPSAYRSLLWRLVDSLALLPVLAASSTTPRLHEHQTQSMFTSMGPSRIASDSRVPKSSSVPARLSAQPRIRRPSKIPIPSRRSQMSRTFSPSSANSPIASVVKDSSSPGQLSVSAGEQLKVLSRRGQLAHCCRLRPRRSHVQTGLVPLSNLLIQ